MAITINGSGSITGISAGGLPDGSVTAADIESSLDLSGKTVTLPAGTGGKVLQVVSTIKTDTFSTSSTSFVDVTGLSVSITPSNASNKILILLTMIKGMSVSDQSAFKIVRNSTDIAIGDASGSRTRATIPSYTGNADPAPQYTSLAMTHLDSPSSTSSVTYKIVGKVNSGAVYVNRGASDSDSSSYYRGVSTITVMEIAG